VEKTCVLFFLAILVLAGCNGLVPPEAGKAPDGMGIVRLNFGDSSAKTVFPDLGSLSYECTFSREGFASVNFTLNSAASTYDAALALGGPWVLQVNAKNSAQNVVGTAQRGDITVTTALNEISMRIEPLTAGSNGTLSLTVEIPGSIVNSAMLYISKFDGSNEQTTNLWVNSESWTINKTGTLWTGTGTFPLAPGSWLVRTEMNVTADNSSAGSSDIVHIYSGTNTSISFAGIAVSQLPVPVLRFDFASANGTSVAAETGEVTPGNPITGTLMNGATLDEVNGINVLSLGAAGNQYFDMSEDTAKIINAASEYTISAYFMFTYTSYTQNQNFWTFTAREVNFNNNWGADRSLTSFGSNDRRLTANLAGPSATAAAPYQRNWHMGPQQSADLAANPPNPAQYPVSGTWNHVMVTHAGQELKMWLNGVSLALEYGPAQGSNSLVFTSAASEINKLAYAWLGRAHMDVTIYTRNSKFADFRIYDKALSETEIAELRSEEIDNTLIILNGGD